MELFVRRGQGSRLWDVDGNEYVDYTMAYGPLILGHAHPSIVAAVEEAMRRGCLFGAQHDGEIALASRLCLHIPNAERVCFTSTGTEAVMLAIRLARAFTGRERVVRFAGHYHGWSDTIFAAMDHAKPGRPVPLTAGQSQRALEGLTTLPWNDAEAVDRTLGGGDIAAVICEPILCSSGCLRPAPGFLERLRELTRVHGSLLIFDEIITGFRLALGGAQQRLNITPDLAVFGKALSGGLPLAAVTGASAVMDLVSDRVVHLGTFNGNTVSTAAGVATLDELARDDGAAYSRMAQIGNRLAHGLRDIARTFDVPLRINSVGQAFYAMFSRDSEVTDLATFDARDKAVESRFAELLLSEGVFTQPGLWYISTSHNDDDVATTLRAAERVLANMHRELSS